MVHATSTASAQPAVEMAIADVLAWPTVMNALAWVRRWQSLVTGQSLLLHMPFVVNFGSCNVEKSATGENSAGVPTYRGRTQITSSCVASDNCQNSVHVISTYQSRTDTRTGSVSLSLSFSGEDTKPLILVLTSYYAIRWTLSIPQGVTVDKVIVVSNNVDLL